MHEVCNGAGFPVDAVAAILYQSPQPEPRACTTSAASALSALRKAAAVPSSDCAQWTSAKSSSTAFSYGAPPAEHPAPPTARGAFRV